MPVTRTIKGNLDRLSVSGGSEITYLGVTTAGNVGDLTRAFRVTPTAAGNLIVNIDKSQNLLDILVYQEDSFTAGSPPAGYQKYFNVVKAGKDKGAVAVNVTNASKTYVVLLKFDNYSDAGYSGNVTVP